MINKMTEPSVDELLKKIDSQYTLVIMASRRARILNDREVLHEKKSTKSITRSLEEILEGKIIYNYKGE